MVITIWKKGMWGLQNLLILRHCKTPQCEYHIVWTKEGQGEGYRIYMAVSLWQGPAQKQLVDNKHGIIGRPLFYIKKMDVLCKRWESKGCRQIFMWNEDLTVRLKEERCTGAKAKIICSGGKFNHILNSSEKVFYGEDTKFSYTVCQWIEAQVIETGKHIHHKMCGHDGERMVTVWV